MAVKEFYGVEGTITNSLSTAATLVPVSGSVSGAIAASGFVNGTDETYFSISAGNVYELVKVTAVNGDTLSIERAQSGTTAQSFPLGAEIKYEVTAQGILDTIGTVSTAITLTGTGLADVTNPVLNEFNIDVPIPAFVGVGGIEILGSYPNYTFTYTAPDEECCGTGSNGSGGGISELQGQGIATAFATGGIGYVNVQPPNFIEGGNITITGTWPNITFTGAAGSGGSVTSVTAGAGITVTGSPTINPTVAITNTGVVAGTYGGVQINARGQITAVPAGFNPVSSIVGGTGLTASRTGAEYTLTPDTAAVGIPGVVALADETDPFNPADNTNAATPAVVAAALSTLPATDALGNSSFIGESDGDYTNILTGSATAVNIAAGEKVVVHAEVTMVDGTAPGTPVQFGLAVFNASPAKVRSNRSITQSEQHMTFIVDGPLNTTLSLATTAVPSGASVTSYSLALVLI